MIFKLSWNWAKNDRALVEQTDEHLANWNNNIIFSLLSSFSHQFWLVDFHWNPNDSKSLQVFRSFRRILADFNSAEVCIVSILFLVSNSSNLVVTFEDRSKRTNYYWHHRHLHLLQLFLLIFFWQNPSIFSFSFGGPLEQQSTLAYKFFLLNHLFVWSSGENNVTGLYLKIPENFMHLIFYERF